MYAFFKMSHIKIKRKDIHKILSCISTLSESFTDSIHIYIYIYSIYIYIYIYSIYIYIYIQYIYKIGVHFLQGGKFFKIHLQIINGESKSCNMTNKSSLCCAQVNNTKTFKSYQTKRAFEIFQ